VTILKVDVDTRTKLPLAELRRRLRLVQVRVVSVTDTRSPSGRGWHRVIEVERDQSPNQDARWDHGAVDQAVLHDGAVGRAKRALRSATRAAQGSLAAARRFTPTEVVFLQLLCGSDPIREAFNWHRARLVQTRKVSPYWRRRWNTFYATRRGKEHTA